MGALSATVRLLSGKFQFSTLLQFNPHSDNSSIPLRREPMSASGFLLYAS
jgi:hypothetical protein